MNIFTRFANFFSGITWFQNNPSIKEEEYPEKMQWCKKCKICWNYNNINKKTKYKPPDRYQRIVKAFQGLFNNEPLPFSEL